MRFAALLLLLLAGCPDEPDPPGDAGATFPDAAPAIDAGPSCACDPDEQCEACFANIGTCCYDDPTLGGRAQDITAYCESKPACKACCNECAAASCDELKATHSCPLDPMP